MRIMPLARRLLLGLALVCASAAHAQAALIIDFVLTPTNVFGAPFGIDGLPAGPFSARFTLDEALPANFNGGLEVDDFAATIGDQTWEFDDLAFIASGNLVRGIIVTTDATGAIIRLTALAREGDNLMEIGFDGDGADWQAGEDVFCGVCVSGTSSIFVRAVDEVPEPAPLLLVTAGLAAIAATRRRHSGSPA
jgi:hypothetical protein